MKKAVVTFAAFWGMYMLARAATNVVAKPLVTKVADAVGMPKLGTLL